MDKEIYEGLLEGLNQALAYERGEIELPSRTFEHTFPDCPPCCHMIDNECIFKDKCVIRISEDGESRVGTPSKYVSMSDIERIIDELNAIGCTSFRLSAEEISRLLSKRDVKEVEESDICCLEGSSEWYEAKIHELQDWILDKEIHADTPNIGRAYRDVLCKVIDMFSGIGVDYLEICEEMDEWS